VNGQQFVFNDLWTVISHHRRAGIRATEWPWIRLAPAKLRSWLIVLVYMKSAYLISSLNKLNKITELLELAIISNEYMLALFDPVFGSSLEIVRQSFDFD